MVEKANYREQVAELQRDLRRLGSAGFLAPRAHLLEGIGNLLREYSHEDPKRYFEDARALRRKLGDEPSLAVAFLERKLENHIAMEAECRALIDRARRAGDQAQRATVLALGFDGAIASLLLGEYATARDTAAGLRSEASNVALARSFEALVHLAESALKQSVSEADRGISVLRALVPEWPTWSSGAIEELLRFALELREQIRTS